MNNTEESVGIATKEKGEARSSSTITIRLTSDQATKLDQVSVESGLKRSLIIKLLIDRMKSVKPVIIIKGVA